MPRFQSEVNIEFTRWRYELMKQLHPAAWVTTNFQGSRATHTDIFEMGAYTDIPGTNLYPSFYPEFSLDYSRGPAWRVDRARAAKRRTRTGARNAPRLDASVDLPVDCPRCGGDQLFPLAHSPLGAGGVLARGAAAQRRPYRRYRELQETGAELERIGKLIAATRPASKVAITLSYASRWAMASVASPQLLTPLFVPTHSTHTRKPKRCTRR